MSPPRWPLLVAGLLVAGCASGADDPLARDGSSTTSTIVDRAVPPATTAPTTTAPTTAAPTTAATVAPATVSIALRLVRETDDVATEDFVTATTTTLTDPRGWEQAGFQFTFSDDAQFTVLLAEPDVVDAACAPYDVQSTYSCQMGPVVALNADRWRSATPSWPGTLAEYRTMLVNHEVGHLLGQHHPAGHCVPGATAAAVMAQQSKGLQGCVANPWPLPWEVACAARHQEPLAPGYEPDSRPICGPADV